MNKEIVKSERLGEIYSVFHHPSGLDVLVWKMPNGSAELVPPDGKEEAGGVTSCGNVARHRKQTRSKRPKPQAYPLRNRLQKRF